MYPLKFNPIFQERIWGGTLRTLLNKPIPEDLAGKAVGESWELADLPLGTVKADSRGGASDGSLSNVITNGPWKGKTLHQILAGPEATQIMGTRKLHNGHFPLLIKFLDAQTNLSVQVHPDAAYCAKHPGSHLKSESWYILHAEPGAKIYKGLQPGVTKEAFRAALESGQVEPLLKAIKVRAGDCHYLESGTVHALGAGILAAEVQTPSDTTFRVFDWNRLGPGGKPRALHIEEALEVIHFGNDPQPNSQQSDFSNGPAKVNRLVTCPYFTLERVRVPVAFEQEISNTEPIVLIILEGQGVISCEGAGPTAFAKGDTLLLPANMQKARIKTVTDSAWLEARIPNSTMPPI